MDLIEISKSCKNCIHKSTCESEKYASYMKSQCINFKHHEFKCDFCIEKLPDGDKRFCNQEDFDDGGFNCCGDKFEFNVSKFKLKNDLDL